MNPGGRAVVLRTYVDDLASRGQLHFTTEQAIEASGATPTAARAQLRRLRQKGAIATPHRGFHVTVPPEYRSAGCLPAEQFVPALMDHLELPYYAGLLTAAERHGAAHQRPQVFQVVTSGVHPRIACGRAVVEFVTRRNTPEMNTVRVNTPRGYLLVSSPETTAYDLVGYVSRCGGLDHVATVLAELAESLSSEGLAALADLSPLPWAQRLGYLLAHAGATDKLAALAQHVAEYAREYVPLARGKASRRGPRDTTWKLLVNARVEPDL
jgi:predicted transcriptional regulator of viral defense system